MNYLTGIKPTGKIHLGNYIGAIKPMLEIIEKAESSNIFFFIADQHAMTNQIDFEQMKENIKDLMISYYAIFKNKNLNDNNIFLYRQSKISEIFQLYWMISCFTAKGLLNRNHSYKAIIEENKAKNKDQDKGVFAGLFNYPILMAADILIMDTNYVPIGKDQLQHIEIANDIAEKINYKYKTKCFNSIQPIIDPEEYILPGKDGNKMSKSYDNTLSLFASESDLKKYIFKIKTNCKEDGEPKFPEESLISELFKAFSTKREYNELVNRMKHGISWKELKSLTFHKINSEIKPYRENYEYYKEKFNTVKKRFLFDEFFVNIEADLKIKQLKEIFGMGEQ